LTALHGSRRAWRGALSALAAAVLSAGPVLGQDVDLAVTSDPVEAAVYVRYLDQGAEAEDVYLGQTPPDGRPLELELEPGPAQLVVYKTGYVCKVEPIDLRAGGAARLEVRLTPDIEIPRRIVLESADPFVKSARESEEIYLAVMAQVVRFYVEELDPRDIVETSVATLVEVLNAVRTREELLQRELSPEARRRYYGEEIDLSGYPLLRFTRGEGDGATRSYRLAAGPVGIEGATEDADLDTYLAMLRRSYAFVKREWDDRGLLSDSVLTRVLIEGLLAALDDEHTAFLEPEDVAAMTVETSGSFGGVGAVVGLRDGRLTVVRPIPGTPGERAGLRPDDRIVAIDGRPTEHMGLEDSVELMRGEIDSPVELTIRRGGQELVVTVVRARVEVRTTAERMLGERVGYVRITSFMPERLDAEVAAALERLEGRGAEAFVIDLRNNPGGLLDQAREIADLFVREGVLVTTRTRMAGESRTYRADPEVRRKFDAPLAVLINGGSASAAEILAGTLREHGRATLVGERTFGKGSVQRVMALEPYGCAFSLTVATYHLPSGFTPHNRGVEPDLVVALEEDDEMALAARSPYTVDEEPVDPQLAKGLAVLKDRLERE